MIYTYLPSQMIEKPVEELTLEEFFRLYGLAESARDLKIADIEYGVAKAIITVLEQLEN